jgi:hypothetical protein
MRLYECEKPGGLDRTKGIKWEEFEARGGEGVLFWVGCSYFCEFGTGREREREVRRDLFNVLENTYTWRETVEQFG